MAILGDGMATEGLDYNVKLLLVFRSKLTRAGLKTVLYHEDARRFNLNRRYGLIFIGFHAISEVISSHETLDVFRNVHRHLAADGVFWVSIHNPPQRRAGLDGIHRPIGTYRLADTSEELHVSGEYRLDERSSIVTGRQVYRCFMDGRETRGNELPIQFHLIAPEQLDELLTEAGLLVTRRLGTYTGERFDPSTSPFYLAECQLG